MRSRLLRRPCPTGEPPEAAREHPGPPLVAGRPCDRARCAGAGRRVVVLQGHEHGTWAERAVVAARNVVVVPDDADALQLSMMGNPVVALLLLRVHETLTEGDWVAQTGANSSVGQCIVKLAKLMGLHTLNVVRREAAAAEVIVAGGDRVIVIGNDFASQLDGALEGQELALVLDSIGGPVVRELAHNLRFGGKVISFGALGGQPTSLAVRDDLIYRDVSHYGFWIDNWLRRAPRGDIETTYREIVELLSSGQLEVDVDRTFRLEQYAEAFERAEKYARSGKVLFIVGS